MKNARACFFFLRTRQGLARATKKANSQLGWRLRDSRRASTDTALALASLQLCACSSTVLHFVDEPPRDTAEEKHMRVCETNRPRDIFRPHDVENADNSGKY